MAVLTVSKILLAGITEPGLVAAEAGGDEFFNDGKTYFKITNGGGGTVVVTITGQKTLPAGTASDKTVDVLTGVTSLIGPFPVGIYNTDGANRVAIAYDGVATVTVGAVSVSDAEN